MASVFPNNNQDSKPKVKSEIRSGIKKESNYYDDGCRQYFENPWVKEVADKVASVMDGIRPFQPTDIFVDIGAGPGWTLEKIFYIDEEEKATIGGEAYLVDVSQGMVTLSKELASFRCPEKGVFIKQMNIFKKLTDSNPEFNGFSDKFSNVLKMPPRIDCAYCSLVSEYFTTKQIIELSKAIFDKLSIGGICAWFEWGTHFKYADQHSNGIYHSRGISKKEWLMICTEITEYVENPDRILKEEMNQRHSRFGPRSEFTVKINIGSFDVENADKQKVPSGNYIHYCILQKESVPSSVMRKQATERIRKPLKLNNIIDSVTSSSTNFNSKSTVNIRKSKDRIAILEKEKNDLNVLIEQITESKMKSLKNSNDQLNELRNIIKLLQVQVDEMSKLSSSKL